MRGKSTRVASISSALLWKKSDINKNTRRATPADEPLSAAKQRHNDFEKALDPMGTLGILFRILWWLQVRQEVSHRHSYHEKAYLGCSRYRNPSEMPLGGL
jgi:hypothetical protein